MLVLKFLEELRTKEELINYFKSKGIDLTEKEIENLKEVYNYKKSNSSLNIQQLDKVVGGLFFLLENGSRENTSLRSTYGPLPIDRKELFKKVKDVLRLKDTTEGACIVFDATTKYALDIETIDITEFIPVIKLHDGRPITAELISISKVKERISPQNFVLTMSNDLHENLQFQALKKVGLPISEPLPITSGKSHFLFSQPISRCAEPITLDLTSSCASRTHHTSSVGSTTSIRDLRPVSLDYTPTITRVKPIISTTSIGQPSKGLTLKSGEIFYDGSSLFQLRDGIFDCDELQIARYICSKINAGEYIGDLLVIEFDDHPPCTFNIIKDAYSGKICAFGYRASESEPNYSFYSMDSMKETPEAMGTMLFSYDITTGIPTVLDTAMKIFLTNIGQNLNATIQPCEDFTISIERKSDHTINLKFHNLRNEAIIDICKTICL